jgi:predicted nucleotidyltransferase
MIIWKKITPKNKLLRPYDIKIYTPEKDCKWYRKEKNKEFCFIGENHRNLKKCAVCKFGHNHKRT